MGRGQGQGSQTRTLGTQERVYAVVSQAECANQPDMQGTFLLLHVLFKLGCIILIIVTSCVMD